MSGSCVGQNMGHAPKHVLSLFGTSVRTGPVIKNATTHVQNVSLEKGTIHLRHRLRPNRLRRRHQNLKELP